MGQNILDKKFVSEVQSGVHVFGSPNAYIKELIKEKDKEIQKAETFKTGEFFMQNKELRAELAQLKARQKTLEAAGEYFLSLINKCDEEPWRNSILFCNVSFRGKNGFINKKKDQEIEQDEASFQDSGFISQKELSLLMNSHVEVDDEDDKFLDAPIYDFVFQTKYGSFFINVNNTPTKQELPLFVLDDCVSTPNGELFELSYPDENIDFDFCLFDVIYNKTGAIFLKNENWENARSRAIHIATFKKDIEDICSKREFMNNISRYKELDKLYKAFYHVEESDFTKNVNKNLTGF